MTLTTENKYVPFSEYYNSVASYEPTEHERLLALIREEIGVRKYLEKDEQRHFTDVLHVAGVFVGDKKFRLGIGKRATKAAEEEQQRKAKAEAARPRAADGSLIPGFSGRVSMPPVTRRAMAVRALEEAVWFPAAEPVPVDPPTRALVPGYPYRAVGELMEEEAELRRWLHGVEARLRQEMDAECNHDLYITLRLKEVEAHEKRGRSRLERDQVETFSAMRNQVFYLAPPEYFRTLVVRRFGASVLAVEEKQRELSFEEQEQQAREAVATEEQAAFENLFDYLHNAYDVQLFAVNHVEFVERENIIHEERHDWYPLMLDSARMTYGLLYEHSPAVFLNMSTARQAAPLMHQMVMNFKATLNARGTEANRTLHSSSRVQLQQQEEAAKKEAEAKRMAEKAQEEAAAQEAQLAEEAETMQERTQELPPDVSAAPCTAGANTNTWRELRETPTQLDLEESENPITFSPKSERNTQHTAPCSPSTGSVRYLATEEKAEEWDEM